MTYNETEKETIGLCVSLEAIDDIVNHTLLEIRNVANYPGEVEVYFNTFQQELFIIRLLDFVKEVGDSKLLGISGSCLQVLHKVCENCSFDQEGSVNELKESLNNLETWLHYNIPIKLWLPSLNLEVGIEVSRLDFITITGNQFKHNLSRLTKISNTIHTLLSKNGYSVDINQIPLLLGDIKEHLQENYFVYYGTWIVELLNNLRWGIQTYLLPIFKLSYEKDNTSGSTYHFNYPADIQNEIPKQWFWRLLNNVRSGPHLQKFTSAHYLKKQSSIECNKG